MLSPGARDRWYSANPGYARALRHTVIPAITSRRATKARIGMGASLGALAMLHAHCRFPDVFDALFLQSDSFFVCRGPGGRASSSHERRFPYYRRIVSLVSGVHVAGHNKSRLPSRPIPVELTCRRVTHSHGDHLNWLRGRVKLLLVCGQGAWEDMTGSLPSTKRFAELLHIKGIPSELDLWGHDTPYDWPSWRAQFAYHMPRFC